MLYASHMQQGGAMTDVLEQGRVATRAAAVRCLSPDEAIAAVPRLAALLVDAVASGASVNFMAGFAQADGEEFWRRQLPEVITGARRIFVAETDGILAGCVVLTFAPQPNAPFRGEIGKMLVHSSMRRRGLGARLLAAAEDAARAAGLTLLLLDTEAGSAGDALYRAAGWIPFGTVPGHSLTPAGLVASATFFYKPLGPEPRNRTLP